MTIDQSEQDGEQSMYGLPFEVWRKLSWQMKAAIASRKSMEAEGGLLSSSNLTREDIPDPLWNSLSYQMRGAIASRKSMQEELQKKNQS